MKRRTFLVGTLGAVTAGSCNAQTATATAQNAVIQTPLEPLIWPVVTKLQPGIRSFDGHTDTVPDVVGRIGTPPSLVIFTEGNHLMALLSVDIVGAFPAWASANPQYANLDLHNIVVVTLPQPVVIEMIRTGGIALGNLTLDVSRKSGFYPDIVMAGPEPLREVRRLGVIEPQARFFSRNRGLALLVREGNPSASMNSPTSRALARALRWRMHSRRGLAPGTAPFSRGWWARPWPTQSSPPRRSPFPAASALSIATSPRWSPVAMRMSRSPSITLCRIGRGYSLGTSNWCPLRAGSNIS
jgi:hypothetical protein